MSTLGQRLKALREERDLSRAKLAAAADVSYTLVNQLERDIRDPSATNLARIAKVLGVTVDSLLSGVPQPEVSEHVEMSARTDPLRSEIVRIVEGLGPEDLPAVRDLLRAWTARPTRDAVRTRS